MLVYQVRTISMKAFRDYTKEERRNFITLSSGEYYPDILQEACALYGPILTIFSSLLHQAESSSALFRQISGYSNKWIRIQLCRIFRKYVSPETPVELLKKNSIVQRICQEFGNGFRPIHIVQERFDSRPLPDEALCALLWEYRDRGKKGYELTEKFFHLISERFPGLAIWGPRRSGTDIQAHDLWEDYPHISRPLDFVLSSSDRQTIYAVGLAHYDGDRGGSQEDDRTGGYRNCADELLQYIHERGLKTKIIFLNDGPGLLLGSMWEDYARLEESHPREIMVLTLRMIEERLTLEWLLG